jgi:protein-arginine kinase activator protein McsA
LILRKKKNQVIRGQKYEEAAKLRDVEKQLNATLEIALKRF